MTKRRKRGIKNAVLLLILATAAIVALFPFAWNVCASLKPSWELATRTLFPRQPTLEHYRAFFQRADVLAAFRNSLIVSGLTGALGTWFAFLAGYGLVRFEMAGKAVLFQSIVGSQFIPLSSLMLPFYLLVYRLKLLDTWWGLVLVYLVYCLPFAVWLLMGFLQKIPKEVEEAACIDGCSRFGAVIKIVLPLARPGLFVTFSFVWIKAWQEYLAAIMLTSTDRARTLPVVLAGLQSQVSFQFGTIMAGVVIAQLPVLIAFVLLNRWFLKGITG